MTLREVPHGHVFFFLSLDDPHSPSPLFMRVGEVMVEIPEDKHTVTVTGMERCAVPLTPSLLGCDVVDVSLALMVMMLEHAAAPIRAV